MKICGALLAALTVLAHGQNFTQRGFLDIAGIGYPQTAPNDSGHAVSEGLFRYEAFYKVGAGFRLAGGIDARADSHRQTETGFHFSWRDRERQRPALALRRLSAAYSTGKLTFEIGKQFVRWGKADIVRPTDRFAPQDYLNLVTPEVLAVTAARLTYGSQTDSIDLIYSPWLTPGRTPLLNQRWAALPIATAVRELPPSVPGGAQWGVRWNHTGTSEYSLSYYQGHDYLPGFNISPDPAQPLLYAQRFYPRIRMYGGDAAIPLSLVVLKGEAAYFTSADARSDEYVLYVAQVERQIGEWTFAGGYAGDVPINPRNTLNFSPLRGFARAVIGRANYTIDVNRGFTLEGAVRQNGKGVWLKPEYTQALGQHWRATLGFAWIAGDDADFIGRYRRNRCATLRIRYSF